MSISPKYNNKNTSIPSLKMEFIIYFNVARL